MIYKVGMGCDAPPLAMHDGGVRHGLDNQLIRLDWVRRTDHSQIKHSDSCIM